MLLSFPLLALASAPLDLVGSASGPLQDAQCNMESVEVANSQQLYALLTDLSEATFFRLISVSMDGKCPYWGGEDDEHECESKAEDTAVPLCSVGTAEPDPFDPFAASFGSADMGMSSAPEEDLLDQTITPEEDEALSTVAETDCTNEELPTFWLDMCSAIPTNLSDYVNLQLNKESYTGYNVSQWEEEGGMEWMWVCNGREDERMVHGVGRRGGMQRGASIGSGWILSDF